MDIHLYAPPVQSPVLSMRLEPDHMGAATIGKHSYLTFQVYVRRGDALNNPEIKPQAGYATLLVLNGTLSGDEASNAIGASLLPPEGLPLVFTPTAGESLLNLAFLFPTRYLQQLEEERAAGAKGQDRILFLRFWGTLAITLPSASLKSGIAPSPTALPGLVQFVEAKQTQMTRLRIALSDWVRRLEQMGYPASRSVDLPRLDSAAAVPEIQDAAKHLQAAFTLFANDQYREAVQRCRQARDALLGESKATWCRDHLTGALGEKKTAMVDECLKALNHLGNIASHAETGVAGLEIDRDTAEYVIGQLTYILHYIDRKLR